MVDVKEIATEILELKDTQVLLLRVPKETTQEQFIQFRNELRIILATGPADDRPRVIVLRDDLHLEDLNDDVLAKLGLQRRQAPVDPYKTPEMLFEAGPLRQAARAGWASALGRIEEAEIAASTAVAELEAKHTSRKVIESV